MGDEPNPPPAWSSIKQAILSASGGCGGGGCGGGATGGGGYAGGSSGSLYITLPSTVEEEAVEAVLQGAEAMLEIHQVAYT